MHLLLRYSSSFLTSEWFLRCWWQLRFNRMANLLHKLSASSHKGKDCWKMFKRTKVLSEQVSDLICQNEKMLNFQSAFRASQVTETAILKVINGTQGQQGHSTGLAFTQTFSGHQRSSSWACITGGALQVPALGPGLFFGDVFQGGFLQFLCWRHTDIPSSFFRLKQLHSVNSHKSIACLTSLFYRLNCKDTADDGLVVFKFQSVEVLTSSINSMVKPTWMLESKCISPDKVFKYQRNQGFQALNFF